MKQKRCSDKRKRTPQLRDGVCTHLRVGRPIWPIKRTSVLKSRDGFRGRSFEVRPVIKIKDGKEGSPNGQRSDREGYSSCRSEAAGVGSQIDFENRDGSTHLVVNDILHPESKLPRRDSEKDYIVIPPAAREWDLSDFPFSARLKHILANRECRRLGDLHGLRFSRILRWRNMGAVTLRTLIAFVKSV